MKILITGGTGMIGQALIRTLANENWTVLSRAKRDIKLQFPNIDVKQITSLDALPNCDEFDAVINLAGEPIADKRWNEPQKRLIRDSRLALTQKLVDKISAGSNPPAVFISGSAIGYYGSQPNIELSENAQPATPKGFSSQLCVDWESIANQAQNDTTRVATIRTGIVLDRHAGALKKMLLPYQLGLGGPIGSGEQQWSWIHLEDEIAAIAFVLTHPVSGAFNLTAPNPVSNREFSHTLAKSLSRPHFLFTPKFAIKALMGESAELLLDDCKAMPKHLIDVGFEFRYPSLQQALDAILHKG